MIEQGNDVHICRHPTCPCLTYEAGVLLAQSPVNWSIDLCAENEWILTNDLAWVEV